MSISSKDRLTIFENVIARVGLDGDVLGEFAKAMSSLNGLQTYNELNPPQPPIQTPQAPIQTPQAPISNEPIPSVIPAQSVGNVPQNTPTGIV